MIDEHIYHKYFLFKVLSKVQVVCKFQASQCARRKGRNRKVLLLQGTFLRSLATNFGNYAPPVYALRNLKWSSPLNSAATRNQQRLFTSAILTSASPRMVGFSSSLKMKIQHSKNRKGYLEIHQTSLISNISFFRQMTRTCDISENDSALYLLTCCLVSTIGDWTTCLKISASRYPRSPRRLFYYCMHKICLPCRCILYFKKQLLSNFEDSLKKLLLNSLAL